jgi:hypothetical protein
LIGTTYTQITMEARKLLPLAMNSVAPTIEAFQTGAYPYNNSTSSTNSSQAFRPIHAHQTPMAGAQPDSNKYVEAQADGASRTSETRRGKSPFDDHRRGIIQRPG